MATVAENLQTIIDSKAAIKAAIEAKGVAVGDAALTQYASKIAEISGGQEEVSENDVNFYDYDGFRVASFTIEEAKALTQAEYDAILPPTHEGLTFQEWNWTLEDIQTYDRQYADIGANYTPNDNKCHIKVSIPVDLFTFYLYLSNVDTSPVWVDWGDGIIETVSANNNTHQYQQAGVYNIKIYPKTEAETTLVGINFGDIAVINPSLACVKELNLARWINLCILNKITSLISVPAAPIQVSGLLGVLCKELTIPRLSPGSTNVVHINVSLGFYCFPKYMQNLIIANVLNGIAIRRIVIPEHMDTSRTFKYFQNSTVIEEISLPSRVYFVGTTFMSAFVNLKKIDIPAGWIPPTNMLAPPSNKFIREDIVDFFNKLGSTTNVITLTFGATNLNKLTAEEKAIATNKGYTLA